MKAKPLLHFIFPYNFSWDKKGGKNEKCNENQTCTQFYHTKIRPQESYTKQRGYKEPNL